MSVMETQSIGKSTIWSIVEANSKKNYEVCIIGDWWIPLT